MGGMRITSGTSHGARLIAGRRRSRSGGAALLVTIVVIIAVSLIAVVIATQALQTTRNGASVYDRAQAMAEISNAKAQFDANLAINPWFFLTKTFTDEQDRVCTTGATTTAVGPGKSWPAACGSDWTYTADPTAGPVVAEIHPPSPQSPFLQLDLVATYGQAKIGESFRYRLDGRGLFEIYSQSNLDLNSLAVGSGTATVGGPVYSGGSVLVPSPGAVTLTDAQIEAEGGYQVAPSASGSSYYGPTPSPGPPPVKSITTLVPTPLSLSSLDAQVQEDHTLGCAATPKNVQLLTSTVCLVSGAKLVTATGTSVTVPEGPNAYLLEFGATGKTGTVTVYTHTATTAALGTCAIDCALPQLAANEVSQDATPGVPGYWGTKLGTFYLPASGVIPTDGPTYLSLCGSAFATTGASCTSISGSTPGMTLTSSVTVVAGTPLSPQNVFVAGPIHTSNGAHLGIVATGDILIPYFARPPSQNLTIDAGLLALGGGEASVQAPSVRTTPRTVGQGADADNADTLTIHGVLIAADAGLTQVANFASVNFTTDPAFVTDPPPWWPGFTGSWQTVSQTTLSTGQVASIG